MERLVEPMLDYSSIRTLEDFQSWAGEAFGLLRVAGTSRDVALALFEQLNAKDQCLVVREVNKAQMSDEMRLLMTDPVNGLYSVLGFHLPREGNGALVSFQENISSLKLFRRST